MCLGRKHYIHRCDFGYRVARRVMRACETAANSSAGKLSLNALADMTWFETVIGGALERPKFSNMGHSSTFANKPPLCESLLPLHFNLFILSLENSLRCIYFLIACHIHRTSQRLVTLHHQEESQFHPSTRSPPRLGRIPPTLFTLFQDARLRFQSGPYGQEGRKSRRQAREKDSGLQIVIQSRLKECIHQRLQSILSRWRR